MNRMLMLIKADGLVVNFDRGNKVVAVHECLRLDVYYRDRS